MHYCFWRAISFAAAWTDADGARTEFRAPY